MHSSDHKKRAFAHSGSFCRLLNYYYQLTAGVHVETDIKMNLTLEELWKMGLTRNLTQEDLERMGLTSREYWIVDPKHEQVTVCNWERSEQPTLYPFSERIKVGVYDDLYLDIVNRHGRLQEVLVEEHQEGIQQGLAALVTSLKAVLPDLDAVCQAVNRNEIYKDIDREEITRYYNSKIVQNRTQIFIKRLQKREEMQKQA